MAKLKPTPVKNQQSISNFFQRKTVNGDSLSQPSQNPPNPPPARRESSDAGNVYDAVTDDGEPLRPLANGETKRQFAEIDDTDKDGRPAKRAKGDENESSPFFNDAVRQKTPSAIPSKSKSSPRTECYVYTGSSQLTPGEPIPEEVEEDDETKAKKKELHEKFVRKLGHPDSLAMIKRRNWQIDADTEALDEDAGEGEDEAEEDETPPPARTRKKGVKTGKLTPLEIQMLAIKRTHMDTLLIVEVGYKFYFYGEDARTAAKELGIVCIPGKYRYDERM